MFIFKSSVSIVSLISQRKPTIVDGFLQNNGGLDNPQTYFNSIKS
ncbi:hypothetical protein Cabys_3949 [Caldithrix abyssi DSM 13497]|uniref:Uncharacterized protein n=1 Tax=Caldithrix abyssi DSM 13497 TaxID=880073 RepID=A0A1J1CDP6_CALAY|nr:hypothetical protein Cabys_3949 [Caldithrix abyssi DSM 13497]